VTLNEHVSDNPYFRELSRPNVNSPTGRTSGLPAKRWLVFWFVVAILLGIWPALTNGQPFFYADTTAYVRGADLAISKALGNPFATDWAKDQRRTPESHAQVPISEGSVEQKSTRRPVLAGRSIVYGMLLYLGELLGGMWFSIIIQSLVAAYLIFLFVVRVLGLDFRSFLITCAFLYAASSLPFFTSFLMPDVFAGFLIVGFAILATGWDRLSRLDRAMTGAILLFAVLAHPTHLILLLGLVAISAFYVVLADRSQWMAIRRLVAVVGACVAISVLWEAVFAFAVSRALGVPSVRPPFITAKLVSMLGAPAVSEVCASHAFVVCRFQGRFPIDDEAFLWSEEARIGVFGIADLQTKRDIDAEQLRFALAIIPPNLRHFVQGVSADGLRQLTAISLAEYWYRPSGLDFFRNRLPRPEFDRMVTTVAARSDAYPVFGRTALYASTALGATFIVLIVGGTLHSRTIRDANENDQAKTWRTATYIQLTGMVLNAIICGGLSSVNNRYQARVIWLIQFSSITGICVLASHPGIASFWKRTTGAYHPQAPTAIPSAASEYVGQTSNQEHL
jgi:hypothetical protein